jgi:drug/metabolite transporter (DMT)-like permease
MVRHDQSAGGSGFILLLLLGVLWGMPYALTKVSLESIPPITLVAARTSLAAAALWLAAIFSGHRIAMTWTLAGQLFLQGCLACIIPYTLITFGQRSVDSSLAAILNSSTPLFVFLIGAASARRESIAMTQFFGVALGLGGVTLIVGASALTGLGHPTAGQFAILLATLSSAVSVMYGRRLAGCPSEVAAAGMLTCAAVVMWPLALVAETPWTASPTSASLAALIANAVVATAAGFFLYFRLIREIGSLRTASASYLKPAVGVLIGCALMGEELSWTLVIGLVAVLFGTLTLNGAIPAVRSIRLAER